MPGALGFVAHDELLRLYERAAVVVCPSRREGFGVVCAEAMAHGRPVVVDAREANRKLRLVGRPTAEMTVEVAANGTRLGSFKLAGGREETVTVQLPPGPRKSVSFSFSDHALDVTGATDLVRLAKRRTTSTIATKLQESTTAETTKSTIPTMLGAAAWLYEAITVTGAGFDTDPRLPLFGEATLRAVRLALG